jgi:tetratricopeptide (TPR) repeat protein
MKKFTSLVFGASLTFLIAPAAQSVMSNANHQFKQPQLFTNNRHAQWRWGTPIPATRPEVIDAINRDSARRQREAEAWARDPQNPVNQDPEIRTMIGDEVFLFYQRRGYTYQKRGYETYDQKDFAKSVAYFDKAIRLCDICATLYASRGLSKYNLNDLTGAMADYNFSIKLERTYVDNAQTFYNRGMLKQFTNDREGAIQDLREAAKLFRQKGKTEKYQNALNQLQKMNATL